LKEHKCELSKARFSHSDAIEKGHGVKFIYKASRLFYIRMEMQRILWLNYQAIQELCDIHIVK